MSANYWIPGTPITGQQAEAETKRLLSTIALAEEALRIAADHRDARHAPGETAGESQDRWTEAAEIETAALDCRKAARKALADLRVFPDKRSPEDIANRIHLARCAALALKRACDAGQVAQNRRSLRLAARDLKRAVAEAAAAEATSAEALRELDAGIAENEARHRKHEAAAAADAAPLALDLAQRREILDLLDQLAGYALEGWEEAGIPEAPQWRKRLAAAQALLTINTEASAK
jgi:hypothetical protein